jgi:hypothetical protein
LRGGEEQGEESGQQGDQERAPAHTFLR